MLVVHGASWARAYCQAAMICLDRFQPTATHMWFFVVSAAVSHVHF